MCTGKTEPPFPACIMNISLNYLNCLDFGPSKLKSCSNNFNLLISVIIRDKTVDKTPEKYLQQYLIQSLRHEYRRKDCCCMEDVLQTSTQKIP